MTRRQVHWRLTALPLLASALALAACAEPQPPTAEIQNAREAIARAQENGAETLAPQPLQMAEEKLNRAQTAVAQEDMRTAEYLAEEAAVDADLAGTTSNAQRVANTASELRGASKRPGPSP